MATSSSITDSVVPAHTKWFETSRSVRAIRPDQQGRWQIRGLPNGDYLAVALDYVEDRAWDDPEFLEGLQRYGRKVSISDGASQSVPLGSGRAVRPG